MKNLAVFLLCVGMVFAAATTRAIDLKQSKVTQVVNDVQIISAADQKPKAAAVNDIFSMPDILRTGPASRAELIAKDETVTRVGANTIFSFDPANRTIDLQQGSLLFHAPHGKGGGSIHTGSATASVLGTTVIITTTPNGGFKVIALEGQVQIKLLNGLIQKLDPGQMTFVLPGANQLAPIVIFRLDELIMNSLLVKGFSQTLASLPLIQNQINLQLKLLQSGKLSDTGLFAGDNASPIQVEVIDPNTIAHGQLNQLPAPQPTPTPPPPPPTPSLTEAEGADATINQPSLSDSSIPTPPNHLFTETPFAIADNQYFSGLTFAGFVARNIYVNTLGAPVDDGVVVHTAASSPLDVDLSPYAALSTFDMVAVNNFSIEGSVDFTGLPAQDSLSLISGNQFTFTPGISIEADVNSFLLSSAGSMMFDSVSLINNTKDITLRSGTDISLTDGSQITAAGNIGVSTDNNLILANSSLNANTAVLMSLSGTIEFDSATLNAPSHSILLAPVAINLNDSTITSGFTTINGTANATVSLNNTTVNAANSLVIYAPNDINISGPAEISDARSPRDIQDGSALISDPDAGKVSVTSPYGSVSIQGTDISAQTLTLNSGDGILLDAYGHTLSSSGTTGSSANFLARNSVTVQGADLSQFAVVSMAANTLTLIDVTFGYGSSVTLKSLTGLLNIMANPTAVQSGYVNFYDVYYGPYLAQNRIGSGITIGKK